MHKFLMKTTITVFLLTLVSCHSNRMVRPNPAAIPELTAEEQAAGWTLLFSGASLDGWRGFKKDKVPKGWRITKQAELYFSGDGNGDIMTEQEFGDFELALEWKISAGGNSGIIYRVSEARDVSWHTGPEMQVLDNARHADGKNPLTSAGSNYALYAPVKDVTQPVGEYNQVRILANGKHVEHWLNGIKVVEYEIDSPEWKDLVAKSKFKEHPDYSRQSTGHIVLQDHGNKVWYRNIKIRKL